MTEASTLANYGPLGVFCALLLAAIVKLYLDGRAASAKHRAEMQEKEERHTATVQALADRHVARAETWMEKYSEHTVETRRLLENIDRRRYGR